MKRRASENMNSKSNAMLTKTKARNRSSTSRGLVLCLRNSGYEASLQRAKFYKTLADSKAETHEQVRVIDESGEDYLYPASYFAYVPLPHAIRRAVLSAV